MGRTIFIQLIIIQTLGLGIMAWATGSDRESRADRATAGLARIEARQQARVDIRGSLKCVMSEENTGQACALEIINAENGAILKILGSDLAMRLFQEGKTQVVASGTLLGDSLRIIQIRAE